MLARDAAIVAALADTSVLTVAGHVGIHEKKIRAIYYRATSKPLRRGRPPAKKDEAE